MAHRRDGHLPGARGADPAVGSVGEEEHVPEYRVETVVPDENVDAVVAALRRAHPYEEPAFDLYLLRSP